MKCEGVCSKTLEVGEEYNNKLFSQTRNSQNHLKEMDSLLWQVNGYEIKDLHKRHFRKGKTYGNLTEHMY